MNSKKKNDQPSLFENNTSPSAGGSISQVDFPQQINLDQKRYSRYVCDSRAIPNIIDGLKPVQRRILWTMWNSDAKTRYTKTVKVAGMTMAYHPHGNASIEDAIAGMVQNFSFANNYPLLEGEGTFGDVLDPKAIASPRYTEVRIAKFAHDAGFFESLEDIKYINNYDDTEKEPIFFIPKIPTVLLNPTVGIATGFRCGFPAREIASVANATLKVLHQQPDATLKSTGIPPWFKGYPGKIILEEDENNNRYYKTHFAFSIEKSGAHLIAAPQGWNREKTMHYLELLCKDPNTPLRDYFDASMRTFKIELLFTKKTKITPAVLAKLFSKSTRESIEQNVISAKGLLSKKNDEEIIKEFLAVRTKLLRTRFERFAKIEQKQIAEQSELIRFIKEKWNEKLPTIKNKATLESILKKNNYVFTQWLADLPIYRLTEGEVKKAENKITMAQKNKKHFTELYQKNETLNKFISNEINELSKKYS